MRLLVYTCVFDGYDRVFPPVLIEPGVDYVLITEDATLQVPGWRTEVVDASKFKTRKAPNRHYKMLAHQLLTGYDASVYVDGNIRVLGPLSRLVEAFMTTGAALGVYPHPTRHSVTEEVCTCQEVGKLIGNTRANEELAAYKADGFPDESGLVETGILLKNHVSPQLTPAMELWWSLFTRYDTRDQISLPYVLWKTRLPCYWHPRSFRELSPYFGIYPHLQARHVSARYVYVSARAHDSGLFRFVLLAWHMKWKLQRWLRGAEGTTP